MILDRALTHLEQPPVMVAGYQDLVRTGRRELLRENHLAAFAIVVDEPLVVDVVAEKEHGAIGRIAAPLAELRKCRVVFEKGGGGTGPLIRCGLMQPVVKTTIIAGMRGARHGSPWCWRPIELGR